MQYSVGGFSRSTMNTKHGGLAAEPRLQIIADVRYLKSLDAVLTYLSGLYHSYMVPHLLMSNIHVPPKLKWLRYLITSQISSTPAFEAVDRLVRPTKTLRSYPSTCSFNNIPWLRASQEWTYISTAISNQPRNRANIPDLCHT